MTTEIIKIINFAVPKRKIVKVRITMREKVFCTIMV